MLLVLMVTSKGMAGVPRASLVVIAATLASFNLPEAGLLLIIGIDQFLDMGRSATNVIGNSLATAVVGQVGGRGGLGAGLRAVPADGVQAGRECGLRCAASPPSLVGAALLAAACAPPPRSSPAR